MQAIVRPSGHLILRNEIFRAALGARGVLVNKEEGDEATPAGVLPLRRVLYRADRVPPPMCADYQLARSLPTPPLAALAAR